MHVIDFYMQFTLYSEDDLSISVQTAQNSSPTILLYICACPDKAAQMYISSMNYASVQPDHSLPCVWHMHVSQSHVHLAKTLYISLGIHTT